MLEQVYIQQQILGKNAIVVLRTIGDSPASKAGLLTGDIITKVDDQEYTGEQLNEAVKKMKGVAGTTVKITVLRDSKEIELLYNYKKDVLDYKFHPFIWDVGGKYVYPTDKAKRQYQYRRGFEDCFEEEPNVPYRSVL